MPVDNSGGARLYSGQSKNPFEIMKKLQALLAAAMCSALLGAATGASAQNSAPQGFGTVVRAVGIASYSLGDNVWHPLQAGKYLPAGSVVRTGHNGEVDIVLGKNVEMPQAKGQPDRISFAPDAPVRGMINYKPSVEQNVVRVMPETTLGIDKLTVTDTGADTVSDTELNLKDGKIFASVKKESGASTYLVKLPNGIAGIRGTMCYFHVADGVLKESGVYESHSGGVVLSIVDSSGGTQTFLVAPGQLLDPATGQPVPIPAELANVLKEVFTALRTIYFQVVDFSFDHTECYVSPTTGGHGKHKGNGNGNGGGEGGGNGNGD
jgi:hypothetical protein